MKLGEHGVHKTPRYFLAMMKISIDLKSSLKLRSKEITKCEKKKSVLSCVQNEDRPGEELRER